MAYHTATERRQAREDGYVECTECGHPIEEHSPTECQTLPDMGCDCPVRWTQAEVSAYRKELGLPARW